MLRMDPKLRHKVSEQIDNGKILSKYEHNKPHIKKESKNEINLRKKERKKERKKGMYCADIK